jgi:hypothetical protein
MNQPSQNPFADQPAQVNPYAAPQMPQPYEVKPAPGYQGGVWRRGRVLIMHQRAQLPPICVKSGAPAATWLKRDLSWHHPLCYLGLLGGLIPFVILALVMTKRATVHVGLTEEWAARRKKWLMIGWGVGLSGLAIFIGGFVLIANEVNVGAIGIPLGLVVGLGGAIAGSIGASIVTPKKIDANYVWLNGVHPDVLNMFPEWPQR